MSFNPVIYINVFRSISLKQEWKRVALPPAIANTALDQFSRMNEEAQEDLVRLAIYSYGSDFINKGLDYNNRTSFDAIQDEDIKKVLGQKDRQMFSAAISDVITWIG